jgi:hypothetical protein
MLGFRVNGADPNCLDQSTCLIHAEKLLEITRASLPDMPKFEMREIEHSLCEADKYLRILEGGRCKRRFNGGVK